MGQTWNPKHKPQSPLLIVWGIFKGKFKLIIDFIQFFFNEHLTFGFGWDSEGGGPITSRSLLIYGDFMNSSFIWYCNFLKLMPQSSSYWGPWYVVGWGNMPQAGRSHVRFLMMLLNIFNWPNPSSCTMALGSTQPLREMSTRSLPGRKGRPARKSGNFTAICEPTA
jgi:hypothetical protein